MLFHLQGNQLPLGRGMVLSLCPGAAEKEAEQGLSPGWHFLVRPRRKVEEGLKDKSKLLIPTCKKGRVRAEALPPKGSRWMGQGAVDLVGGGWW